MRQRERTCNSVCNSVREADIIWQKTKEVLTHVTGNFGQLSPDKHNLPSEANTDMSLLMSLSTMAYDWDVHFKRRCQREHLLHTRLLHILLKSTKCLHLWAPAGSNRQGRRGRALDGQQCGGSVSITIPQDAYWSGTNLICSLFFPGLRTPNLLALCCDKNASTSEFSELKLKEHFYRNVLKMRGVHLNNVSSFRMRTVIWFGMLIYPISTHIWARGSVLHISRRERKRESFSSVH